MRGSKKLKAWRELKDLSQAEAARAVGTQQGTWGAWERDEKRPGIEFIVEIERLTEGVVTPRDWLGQTAGKKPKLKTDAAAE